MEAFSKILLVFMVRYGVSFMMCFFLLVELPEKQEQLQAIYKELEELPTGNFNTLERLIFHLVRLEFSHCDHDINASRQLPQNVCGPHILLTTFSSVQLIYPLKSNQFSCRVCKEEAHNRMSPNSLAIVFAPCVLRCPDSADPLLSMKDVAKTTT